MKTAMKFQNKSPEEIVRRYRRNVRLKQGLVILALLAYTAFAIREIWWNDVSFLGLLLGELLVFLALTPVGVWIAWDFLALNAILNINCDPVTYAQVMHLLGQKRNRKRSAITIQINEAIGDMWTGRFSEALSLVKSLPELNAGDQISVLYIRFNCCIKLKDIEGALQARQETKALTSTAKKSSLQKRGGTITGYDGFQSCSGTGGLRIFPAHGRNGKAYVYSEYPTGYCCIPPGKSGYGARGYPKRQSTFRVCGKNGRNLIYNRGRPKSIGRVKGKSVWQPAGAA